MLKLGIALTLISAIGLALIFPFLWLVWIMAIGILIIYEY